MALSGPRQIALTYVYFWGQRGHDGNFLLPGGAVGKLNWFVWLVLNLIGALPWSRGTG